MPSELYYPFGSASLVIDTYKSGTIASSATNIMWTPALNKSIVLFGFILYQAGTGTAQLNLYINAATSFYQWTPPINTGVSQTFEGGLRIFAPNDTLRMKCNAATSNIWYTFYGTEI